MLKSYVSLIRRGFSSNTSNKKSWLLQYTYVDNMLECRQPYRDTHLKLAKEMKPHGLTLGGAFASPVDGAALAFLNCDESVVKSFIEKDPYVKNGLVTKYTIREWTIVK